MAQINRSFELKQLFCYVSILVRISTETYLLLNLLALGVHLDIIESFIHFHFLSRVLLFLPNIG